MRRIKTYYCPQCGGSFLLITEQKLYCLNCRLIFNRKILNTINSNTSLTEEEFRTKRKTVAPITEEKNQ